MQGQKSSTKIAEENHTFKYRKIAVWETFRTSDTFWYFVCCHRNMIIKVETYASLRQLE